MASPTAPSRQAGILGQLPAPIQAARGFAPDTLLSDLAAGVTAEITYVDGGFSQVVGGIAEPSA